MTPPAAQRAGTRNRHRAVAGRLASLFDQHASMVLGLCRLLLRDHHEAEDAAQQTFVSAYRSLLRGTEPRDAAPWLAAIARNECRARIRKRMRTPLALEHELEELADPTDIADESERRAELAALTAAIAGLPSRQREAVALRDFLGLSYEEVASTLSVSVPVVESLLFRARRRLRDTVRTVPRYAAGLVAIPLAVRAAVSRELPELDSQSPAGAAGIAGAAAAGMLAKIISLPFAGKAATAVTAIAVATAGPQLPELFDGEGGASQSAVSALHDSPGHPPAAVEDPPSKPPLEAIPAPAPEPPPATDAAVVAPAPADTAPPEIEADQPAPSEDSPAEPIDPTREIVTTGAVEQGETVAPPPVEPETVPPLLAEPAPATQPEPAPPAAEPVTTPAGPPAEPLRPGADHGEPGFPAPGGESSEGETESPEAPADPAEAGDGEPGPTPSGDEGAEGATDSPEAPADPAEAGESPAPQRPAHHGAPDGLAADVDELLLDRFVEPERLGGSGQ